MLRLATQAACVSPRGCRLHVGEGLAGEHVKVRVEGGRSSLLCAGHRFHTLRWEELPGDAQWL